MLMAFCGPPWEVQARLAPSAPTPLFHHPSPFISAHGRPIDTVRAVLVAAMDRGAWPSVRRTLRRTLQAFTRTLNDVRRAMAGRDDVWTLPAVFLQHHGWHDTQLADAADIAYICDYIHLLLALLRDVAAEAAWKRRCHAVAAREAMRE